MPVGTEEITELLDKIIARYKPGGEFGKAELALLERAKTKSLASTAQGLVSAGLAGTTAGVGAGRKWEEEIGMPSRLRLEDIRTERLTQAMGAKAGYIERVTTREEQLALAREQMELEEKFRNKQISIQEYLAASDRLRAKATSSGTVQPTAPTARTGGVAGGVTGGVAGGYGAGYGGMGAGYDAGGGGFAPGGITFREGGQERPAGRLGQLAEMAQQWLEEEPEYTTLVGAGGRTQVQTSLTAHY